MKKRYIALLGLALLLSGCAPSEETPTLSGSESRLEETAVQEDLKALYFDPATLPALDLDLAHTAEADGRRFSLEDGVDTELELPVYYTWLAEITGDFDTVRSYSCDALAGELDAAEQNYAEGLGFASVTLHSLTTLPADCLDQVRDERVEEVRGTVEQEGLTDFALVEAEVSWTYTTAAEEQAPQLPAGTYTRTYLVGRTGVDTPLKIYEVTWETFTLEWVEG